VIGGAGTSANLRIQLPLTGRSCWSSSGNSVSSLGRAFFPKKSFGRRRRRSWAALRRWRQATARRVSTGACLIPDGPTVDVVFPDRLSFDPDDLSALAETRAECVRWIESAQSDIDKAAAILATFNVVVLLCSAGEELRGSADSKFRSRADQSAFVGWLEAIEEEQRELSTRCDDAFNALSRADAEAAVAAVETRWVSVIGRVPRLHQRARPQLTP
jgi:hypothetical protein